jgi:hypothetical protein
MAKKKDPRLEPTLDDFLKEEGIYEELHALVVQEKAAFQLKQRATPKKN